MQKLISRIDAKALGGTVIVAPLLNVPSFERMTPHVNPVDGKGMNALYPGDANGTQSQRALAAVTQHIVIPSDVVVDLHGGDLDEDLRSYSYWYRGGNAKQDSAGLKLALAFGLDHIIVTDADPKVGRSLSGQALSARKAGAAASREAEQQDVLPLPADVAALVDGSLNVLGSLGMRKRAVTPLTHPVWLDGAGSRVAADSVGVFFAAVPRDTRVKKGHDARAHNGFSRAGAYGVDVVAPIDGLVTFIRGVPSMWPKATLVNVAPVLAAPKPWAPPH